MAMQLSGKQHRNLFEARQMVTFYGQIRGNTVTQSNSEGRLRNLQVWARRFGDRILLAQVACCLLLAAVDKHQEKEMSSGNDWPIYKEE